MVEITRGVANELRGIALPQAPTIDSSLDHEYGLDSLARVELISRVEKSFAVSMPERAAFEAETPRDLMRLVVKARSDKPLTIAATRTNQTEKPDNHIELPARAESLTDVLTWFAQTHPDRTHIRLYDDYSDGAAIDYGSLYQSAQIAAAGLQKSGLLPDERVALMLPTSADYFIAFFGVLFAGGVPVPIYPPVRRQQLEDHLKRQQRILETCQAAMLVTNAEALSAARLLTLSIDSLRRVFDLRHDILDTTDSLVTNEFEPVVRTGQDIAFLQYTSGSTGDPKGVVLTHDNLMANIRADGAGMAVTSDDVFVSWLPLYHDMGLIGAWLGSMYHAVEFVVMPPLSFLSKPQRWFWAIHRYGGSLSAAPNFAYELCLKRIADKDIEGLDLSHWRVAANGAEAISAATMDAFCTRFSGYGFARTTMFPVYGLAECSVGLTFSPLNREPLVDRVDRQRLLQHGRAEQIENSPHSMALVSCGRPLAGHEVRIVDEQNRELPDREEGRVQFRGPSATQGYFNRPDATAALFCDGWLETGDRGYIASGELYVSGRTKDMIIRAGRNIFPAELEDAIGNLDGIRKGHVAVFGVAASEDGSEKLVVLAETRKRDERTLSELNKTINKLATELITVPADEVVFAPPNTVLRTSSGKIRRGACRDLYINGHIGEKTPRLWLQIARLLSGAIVPQWRRLKKKTVARLYAAWAWATFSTLALLLWLMAWLPLSTRALWQIGHGAARTACRLAGIPVTIEGAEHLDDIQTGAVLVANHQSYLDGILMLAVLRRPVRFLVKAELEQSSFLRTPLLRLGTLFVERFDARGSLASLSAPGEAITSGESIMVFPEGTFRRMPGLLPFHMGAFTVAAEYEVPLIPVAIHGTRQILRADSWFPRRGLIRVSVGSAITPRAGEQWQSALDLRDRCRRFLLQQIGEPDLAHESNKVETG